MSDESPSNSKPRSKSQHSSSAFPQTLKSLVSDIAFDAWNTAQYFRHFFKIHYRRVSHLNQKSDHPPVILLQGFMGTHSVLDPLDRFMRDNGRHVFLIDLGLVNVRDIRESAETLLFEIERIVDEYSKTHGFKKFDIVAHSMGGLIALYYIKKLGGHRLIRKLICLGSPFRGTWAATLGAALFGLVSKGVWQMLPRSSFLTELHQTGSTHKTQIYSIAAQNDTVCPPRSCFLKGAVNRILPLGHASLVMDKRVFETILSFLDSEKLESKIVEFEHFRH
jgi:pimeloyl-ACP methyl ester carboxylesterase